MLSMHLPSMLILMLWAFSTPVKSVLVNWLPWSVLKISGLPNRRSASSRASTQKSECSVFESRQASCTTFIRAIEAGTPESSLHFVAAYSAEDLGIRQPDCLQLDVYLAP